MTSLTEGRLTFDFPENTLVSQYDEWSFYRNQFGRSFDKSKAVDFIYVDGDQTWLIEVKDYRWDNTIMPSNLADVVADKVKDTLAGLVCAKYNANNADEKNLAIAALDTSKMRVVLHLESGPKANGFSSSAIDPADLLLKLKKRVKPLDAHPCIVDRNSLKQSINWTVT